MTLPISHRSPQQCNTNANNSNNTQHNNNNNNNHHKQKQHLRVPPAHQLLNQHQHTSPTQHHHHHHPNSPLPSKSQPQHIHVRGTVISDLSFESGLSDDYALPPDAVSESTCMDASMPSLLMRQSYVDSPNRKIESLEKVSLCSFCLCGVGGIIHSVLDCRSATWPSWAAN